ncbi:MAG: hypothetical protein JXB49_18110 [Bacteroidales bacterium]|nr:hypothetical protein [Bacteroidales bacterium]
MKKPPNRLMELFHTNYKDLSVFAANARLLQSIYRHEKNLPIERRVITVKGKEKESIFGNYIDYPFAKETLANLISENTKKVVRIEMADNKKRQGNEIKQIKEKRLFGNLLSSQPLAFNLFSELSVNIPLANQVFQTIFKDRIIQIESINFEISPGRGDCKYTCDHSAFDVFIRYKGEKGVGFIGVEVKYSEALKDNPAKFKPRYKEVAEFSGVFTSKGIEMLMEMPMSLEQIWRDHLLALSMIPPVNSDYQEGFFVYLYPKDNTQCYNALDRYFSLLKSTNSKEIGIYPLILEDIVSVIKANTNALWIKDFEDRYLAFDKIEKIK